MILTWIFESMKVFFIIFKGFSLDTIPIRPRNEENFILFFLVYSPGWYAEAVTIRAALGKDVFLTLNVPIPDKVKKLS